MDKNTFKHILDGLYEALGFRLLSRAGMQVWYAALGDLTEDQLLAACGAYAATASSDQRLTPQVLRELSGVQNSTEQAALLAWEVAKRAVKEQGYFRTPTFDDPVISWTIQSLNGWIAFCQTPSETFHVWTRKEFLRIYTSLRHGNRVRSHAKLIGESDQQNHRLGFTDRKADVDRRITLAQQKRSQKHLTGPAA